MIDFGTYFPTIQSHNASPTYIRFSNNLSYSTSFRNPFRCQLLEPLNPHKYIPKYTQGMPHLGSISPLIMGHAQLDQIKWHPIITIKEIHK